jgi:hypothetical protein
MSLPSNGITPEVIREMMPEYHLSLDLLQFTFSALPAPPREASTAWRHTHVARLTQEISTLMPANATQARMAADILIARELARTIAAGACAPGLTMPQMARLGRVSGELMRTAGTLVRTLEQTQQKPAPFFGTVLADAVDVAAVDAVWGKGADWAGATPEPAAAEVAAAEAAANAEAGIAEGGMGEVGPRSGGPHGELADAVGELEDRTARASAAEMAGAAAAMISEESEDSAEVTVSESGGNPDATAVPQAPVVPLEPVISGTGPRSTPEGVVTRLSQGPGWTLDVVRPRTGAAPDGGAAPGGAV